MNKFVIETPKGNVNVIISDDEMHPGVIIEVANKQVARVEIDQEENNVNAYLWDETKQDDFLHKVSTPIPIWETLPDHVATVFWDVSSIAESVGVNISDDEKVAVAETVIDQYDHGDYNDYIKDLLTS